jgi:hypothetical protein
MGIQRHNMQKINVPCASFSAAISLIITTVILSEAGSFASE